MSERPYGFVESRLTPAAFATRSAAGQIENRLCFWTTALWEQGQYGRSGAAVGAGQRKKPLCVCGAAVLEKYWKFRDAGTRNRRYQYIAVTI
jgi:hypothetical protein